MTRAPRGWLGIAGVCLAALTGCGADPGPATVISERCQRDGEAANVCRCVGERAVALLEPVALQAVLMAAEGQVEEADQAAARLPVPSQESFAAHLARIDSECRGNPALVQSGS